MKLIISALSPPGFTSGASSGLELSRRFLAGLPRYGLLAQLPEGDFLRGPSKSPGLLQSFGVGAARLVKLSPFSCCEEYYFCIRLSSLASSNSSD